MEFSVTDNRPINADSIQGFAVFKPWELKPFAEMRRVYVDKYGNINADLSIDVESGKACVTVTFYDHYMLGFLYYDRWGRENRGGDYEYGNPGSNPTVSFIVKLSKFLSGTVIPLMTV